MSKRASVKKTGGRKRGLAVSAEGEPGKSTFTTRFDPEQRNCVEQAARLCGVSAGEFVRNASVQRAVEKVNANGPERGRLRELARVMVRQLLDPRVIVERAQGEPGDSYTKPDLVTYLQAKRDASDMENAPDWVQEDVAIVAKSIQPERPHDADLKEIESALRTCGWEFVAMVLEEWSLGLGIKTYKPKLSAANLLREGVSE